jgi:hypothetical protein
LSQPIGGYGDQMSGDPRSRLVRWQQRAPGRAVTASLPYALLIVLAAIAIPWRTAHGATAGVGLSLCALIAGWMLFMWRLHPTWRTRVPHVVVFVVGLQVITVTLVIWEALAFGSGWFGFLVAVCFAYARALPRLSWQLAGAAGAAFIGTSAQTAGINSSASPGIWRMRSRSTCATTGWASRQARRDTCSRTHRATNCCPRCGRRRR